MKTIRLLIVTIALISLSQVLYAQKDYDFYLQKARQRLVEGDCTLAEASYNTYKDLTNKTDKEIERLIEYCKTGGPFAEDPYLGYQNQNGLYYRFFTQNEGATPQVGDLVDVNICCMINDSTPLIPNTKNLMQVQASAFDGDIFEGLRMMHKGDSASFVVNIDSTFKYLFGRPTLPEEFKSTDVMRFEIKVNDFFPEKEYAQNFANDIKNRNDQRAAQLQNDYPEETAKAAKELADFLVENKVVAKRTASGLYYVVIKPGNGERPEAGKPVTAHYTGKLLDGSVFDSSVDRGQPFQFVLGVGQVIPGWDEGLQLMSKGEKGVLYIPYYLAYGERDMGTIPPFSNLIFEIELIDFETFE